VLLRYLSFGSVWAQELEWHLLAPLILFGMSYASSAATTCGSTCSMPNFPPRKKYIVDLLSLVLLLVDRAAVHQAVARLRGAVLVINETVGRPRRHSVPLGREVADPCRLRPAGAAVGGRLAGSCARSRPGSAGDAAMFGPRPMPS
jgi:hypothetical protein